jgi:hypothetical protein
MEAGSPMSEQLDYVCEATEILARPDGMPKERLVQAGIVFWQAMLDPADWPPDLLEEADGIVQNLLANGMIPTTVQGMDAATVEQVIRAIQSLSADIEARETRA